MNNTMTKTYTINETDRQQLLEWLKGLFNGGAVEVWKLGGSYAPTLALEMLQSLAPVEDVNSTHTHPLQERKHVGDSRFESWYSETSISHERKQAMREAYEAGMNDHPAPLRELSDEEISHLYENSSDSFAFARAVLAAARGER